MSTSGATTAIILAAGKGTRMKADLPKVVHEVGGRPMVCAVVDACREAGCTRIIVVVGYKQELVRAALAGAKGVEFAVQDPQHGTGHAVQCAEAVLKGGAQAREIFVLAGDGPLIRAHTLRTILERHRATSAAASLATAIIDDPTGYGRIVRDTDGRFVAIVEHKNATAPQRAIREVNPSYYCFDPAALFPALAALPRDKASGEYYLTDVLPALMKAGKRIEVIPSVPPEDVLSINTPEELATVDGIFRQRRTATPAAQPAVRTRA